jgi:hypothetical protein
VAAGDDAVGAEMTESGSEGPLSLVLEVSRRPEGYRRPPHALETMPLLRELAAVSDKGRTGCR